MHADSRSVRSAKLTGNPAPAPQDPYMRLSLGVALLFTLTLPSIFILIGISQPKPPVPVWSVQATALGVNRFEIARGELVYRNSCGVCHGPSGEGVQRLGKPLRNSAFVQSQSDSELMQLIIEGRGVSDPSNTTGALMPPRGAQGISDEAVSDVVTFLRALQDAGAPPVSMAAWELGGADTGAGSHGAAAIELTSHAGYELFVASCAACHGQGGEGITGLGLPITTSGFIRGQNDKDLISFIKMGRPLWDENNTTGLDMPPKGGNPAITDDQLRLIVEYMRAMQKEAMGS